MTDASLDRTQHKGSTRNLKAKDRNPSKGSYENRNDSSGSPPHRPLSKKTLSSSLADRNHRNEFRTKNSRVNHHTGSRLTLRQQLLSNRGLETISDAVQKSLSRNYLNSNSSGSKSPDNNNKSIKMK